ncbi:transposase [Streptococcus pneumoniae GA49447]|nr:transposase [Streptococcus pneumoniae GA49447]
MEQLHFITKLLDIKDPNIQILDIINKDTHRKSSPNWTMKLHLVLSAEVK